MCFIAKQQPEYDRGGGSFPEQRWRDQRGAQGLENHHGRGCPVASWELGKEPLGSYSLRTRAVRSEKRKA